MRWGTKSAPTPFRGVGKSVLISLFLIAVLGSKAQALSLDRYGFGYGLLSSGMFSESVTSSGEPSVYGSMTFHFLTAHINWKADYKYGLRLGYTVLPRESKDGAVDVTQLLISPQFGVPFAGNWEWNTSVGYLQTKSKGNGGSVTLNNGTGSSTFYRPSNTVTSQVINLETGLKYYFSGGWFASGDLFFNSLLGERRNMSLFITLGYSFGGSSTPTYSAPSSRQNPASRDYDGPPISEGMTY